MVTHTLTSTLKCRCGQTGPSVNVTAHNGRDNTATEATLRALARSDGWTVEPDKGGVIDLCPKCSNTP